MRISRFRQLRPMFALALVGVVACDIPTAPPRFENVFVVRAADLSLGAADIAPNSVTLAADSSAFQVQTDPVPFSASLGQMCSACAAAQGATVPKPAFTYSFEDTVPLPLDVVSAQITGATITLGITNNLGFDPIRPSASARGSVVITLRNGTTTVATYAMNGNTIDLPQGITRTVFLNVGAFTWNEPLVATVDIDSPAGDPVTIDTARSFGVVAGPVDAGISQATINVGSRSFADTTDLDLTDMSGEFSDEVQGGAIRFQFVNPFNVGGSFTLRLDAPGASVTKSVTLAPNATSTSRVSLTAGEIVSLLGQNVRVIMEGTFSAPGGQLTLSPDQVARIITDMELTLIPFGG